MATTFNLKYPKFLLFGDSITEFSFNSFPFYDNIPTKIPEFNLGGYLTNQYIRKYQVINRGFSGYTSEHGRVILPEILKYEEDIKLMTIFFGTNDATKNSPQTVELSRFLDNSKTMIELAKSKGIKVIVIGPGLHNAEKWYPRMSEEDIKMGKFRTNENNKLYQDELHKLCDNLNVPFIGLYDEFLHYDINELLTDGIHFTGKAYEILGYKLMDTIKTNYPDQLPENIPSKLPFWRDITENFRENLEIANK